MPPPETTGGRFFTSIRCRPTATIPRESVAATTNVYPPEMAVPAVSIRTLGPAAASSGENVTEGGTCAESSGGSSTDHRYAKVTPAGPVAVAESERSWESPSHGVQESGAPLQRCSTEVSPPATTSGGSMVASTRTRSVRTPLSKPIESTTASETSCSPAHGKTTVNSAPLPVPGKGSHSGAPDATEAFQDQPAIASPGSSSWLAVPRKSNGRFEPAESGGSITATGAAFATHCPDLHQRPDGQGAEVEQLMISGSSPHPARESAAEKRTRGAQRGARLEFKMCLLRM